MTADDLLGTLSLEVPANFYPEGQIPPSQSIPAAEREILQAIAPGYTGSIAFFQAADATVGLSTPGPDASSTPPFTIMADNIGVTLFPPDGIVLHYIPAPAAAPLPPGETQTLTLSFRSEKMAGEAVEEDFMVTVTVSIVSVPAQTPLETNDAEDFMHPLSLPGFDLAEGDFIVISVINTDDTNDDSVLGLGVFAVSNGILRRSSEIGAPPPPGRYNIVVEMTHPDIRGPVNITVEVVVRGFLNPATHNLSFPSAPVLVAPGYDGNLHLRSPANISLASAAPEDARVDLPDAFPAGVSLELSDSREVVPHLTAPLAAGDELIAVLSLTIARADDIYAPVGQLVTLAVSALALPPSPSRRRRCFCRPTLSPRGAL